MHNTRGLQAHGVLVALALSLAAPAFAAETDEQAIKLDQAVQALKEEVLEFNAQAQSVENEALLPAHARLSVYLGVKVSGLLLEEISVMIDDRRPEIYHYDENDARALLAEKSVQRIVRTTVTPGAHRVRVTFRGRYADDKENAAPVTDTFEAIFDKDQRPADLEFTIARERRFGGKPRITMQQWRAAK